MNRRQRRAQAKLGRTARSAGREPALDKLSPAELLQLGLGHHHGGRRAEAEACYRRALADRPDLVVARYNLGVVLHDQGKIDEAIAAYHEAIRANPRYEPAYSSLGHALKTQGRLEEAVGAFKHSGSSPIMLRPTSASPLRSTRKTDLKRSLPHAWSVADQSQICRGPPASVPLLRLGMPDEAILPFAKQSS